MVLRSASAFIISLVKTLQNCLQILLRIQWRLIFANVIRCFRLRLWVGYFIYFEFTLVFFYLTFFNWIKKINSLIRKRMSNIYFKFTIENSWRTQNIDFLRLKKKLVPWSDFGELQLTQISLNFIFESLKISLNLVGT